MADEFTTDTTQWAIVDEGVYMENSEFVYVKTDSEGKILWAIKTDGDIYYGAGVPQQVIDYIEEKLADLSLDEYEDIVAFLNGLEEGDKTLQMLLNEKVDKEEGKSTIDAEYASTKSTVDNSEFLEVTLDTEDKVLEGIQQDGTKVIGGSTLINGDAKIVGNMEVSGVSYKIIENSEYLAAWVDAEDKVVFGFKTDGKTYVGDTDFLNEIKNNQEAINEIKSYLANFDNLDIDALSSITTVESPEYIEAKTDLEGKLLAGRTPNGIAFENVGLTTPKVSIDGHVIEDIEDPEGRTEITTDSEGKIISYRDSDGVKYEEVGIKTNHLGLTKNGMTDFLQDLKNAGIKLGGIGDWSDYISKKGKNPIHLPIPKLAYINFTNKEGNLVWPSSKKGLPDYQKGVNADFEGIIEYSDMQGNYFKKNITFTGQGTSSMAFVKKNVAIKIFDDSIYNSKGKFGKGDGFGINFGDWVMQTGFHLKAYYTDYLRGSGMIAYQISDEVYKTRGIFKDRPWKKALIDFSKILSSNPANLSEDGTDDLSLQIDNGATCMPDGFPCICYLNGEFYGVFSFQIKKDAANYHLNKDRLDNIQLDGRLGVNQFWGGNIDWTEFEIRTPEDLICMNGEDYDGDNPSEIIDSTSEFWNPNDENHVRTATIKQYIVNLSKRIGEINTLNETDPSAAKDLFDTYFDADNLIDYQIIQMAVGDPDGFEKNWQWVTYDGVKWWACQYDKDQSFGNHFVGMFTTPPSLGGWGNSNTNLPTGLALRYYLNEHKLRWNEMVQKGIFSKENFILKIKSWIDRIGEDNLAKEWEKWNESPCNRDSLIDYENWIFTGEYSATAQATWNAETEYAPNETVWFNGYNSTNNWKLQFRAVKANINKPCLTGSYATYPQTMGYRDSLWRYCKYIEQTLINQDTFINNL